MKDNKVYLTDEGFLELEEELQELKEKTGKKENEKHKTNNRI